MSTQRIPWRLLPHVVAGGALGVAARAGLSILADDAGVPLLAEATLVAINVAGALLLGAAVGALGDGHPRTRSFIGTGVLGGFTSYSAFAVQAVALAGSAPLLGLVMAVVTVAGGWAAAAAGHAAGGALARRGRRGR